MDSAIRGLPLLSGTAPIVEEPNRNGCRKCGKEFGLFTRSRTCNHCGFTYCSTCSDHQALVARKGGEPGYDSVPVCAYCIPNLTITASGRTQLRSMPVPTLKAYLKAYGLSSPANMLEKEEIVDAILNARGPSECLPAYNEDFYRKHSVPNRTPERRSRSLFSRMADMASSATSSSSSSSNRHGGTPNSAPRTNPQTRPSGQQHGAAPPRPAGTRPSGTQQQTYQQSQYNIPSSNPYSYRPPQPAQSTRPRPSPHNSSPPAATDANAGANSSAGSAPAATPSRPPPPPVPTMDALLEMSSEELHALSVGTLKSVLYDNHVLAPQALEKDDLVAKVQFLVDNERRDRSREAEIRAMEEQVYLEQQRVMREEFLRQQAERERAQEEARRSMAEHHEPQEENVTATRMSVDIQPPTPIEFPAPSTEGNVQEHDHDHGHSREHLDVPRDRSSVHSHSSSQSQHPATVPTARATSPGLSRSPSPSAPMAYNAPTAVERSGLCVICQDEEANIVVVDCGHLAMCRSCSDLVMNTNRECPLCRTRIVTQQRLLRVFRT